MQFVCVINQHWRLASASLFKEIYLLTATLACIEQSVRFDRCGREGDGCESESETGANRQSESGSARLHLLACSTVSLFAFVISIPCD